MAKARLNMKLVAGCVLLLGSAGPALAQQVTPDQLLQYRPIQPGVVYTIPTAEEKAQCTVKVFPGTVQKSTGYLLLDPKGQPLRRFFDSNGDRKVDIWSYFKDGAEVYREIDSNFDGTADQFRWLGEAGMKWGVDINQDGKIDAWKMISAEEVAQEAFQAVASRDMARLRSLFISDAELKALKLPADQDQQIRQNLNQLQNKLAKIQADLPNLNNQAIFKQVEAAFPSCQVIDNAGVEQDLIKYPHRVILYEDANKKSEFIQSGGLVQVGMAWRLIDAPNRGDTINPPPDNPLLQQLTKKLEELDKRRKDLLQPGPDKDVYAFNLERIAILEQILAIKMEPVDREAWIRQIADNLSTAAQAAAAGDKSALQRLSQLRDQITKAAPGTNLAGYVTYRELWGEFGVPLVKTTNAADMQKLQQTWLDRLSKFVQQYPRADDAADALFHLVLGCEFGGKEDEAKGWCKQLVANFPEHPMAAKARGIERRLSLVGNPLQLSAPTLQKTNFDLASLSGKVVVVYYWESKVGACIGDFARLRQFKDTLGAKGLEIVTVNLDENEAAANSFLANNALQVPHLFQTAKDQTGLNSPLATQYGIMGLPTIFLVGRDGRVISRTIQINDLEEAIRKAQ